MVQPGILLALGQPERHRGAEQLHRVQLHVVVGGGVADVDGQIAHPGKHLQSADEFSRRPGVDLETPFCELSDPVGEKPRCTEHRLDRRRPAQSHIPLDLRPFGLDGGLGFFGFGVVLTAACRQDCGGSSETGHAQPALDEIPAVRVLR